ncbi:unnamed protein product, partial [marine sediment metagenome]
RKRGAERGANRPAERVAERSGERAAAGTDPRPKTQTQEKDAGTRTDSAPPARLRVEDLVFEHWKRVMGHPTAKFTRERRAKVKARLAEGYTLQQLTAAVDGCRASAHHMGRNDSGTVYDDLELICRNGGKVEGFLSARPAREVERVREEKAEQAREAEGFDLKAAEADRDRKLVEMRANAKAARDRGLREMRGEASDG